MFNNTLAVIRQYLSSSVGDLIEGTFDSGTTTTGVHTLLRKADDYYNEHKYRAYIYGGTDIGEEREIDDWVKSTNTLTFDPAFSSAIDVTSSYELHRIFFADELKKAINLAIATLADKYFIDKTDVTTVLVADVYEYTLPSGMDYVTRITTEETADEGIFEESDVIDTRNWRLISPRKLKLHEDYYSVSAGKDLRIEGQGRQSLLSADTDICYLPPDWIVQKAITMLPWNKIQSNQLDGVYSRAWALSAREPVKLPDPWARAVVE